MSELRLAGATTVTAANQVLWEYLPQFNTRFAVPAAQAGSAYRTLPPALDVERICCFKYARVVAADNTVQFGAHRLQLLPSQERTSYAKAHVEVQERLDGSVGVYYQGRCVASQPAPAEAPVLRARKRTTALAATATEPEARAPTAASAAPPSAGPPTPKRPSKPGPSHVWRQPFTRRQQLRAATAATTARSASEP